MIEWLHATWHAFGLAIGWVFSPSWLPPKDFSLLRWLVVPGYGYGVVLLTIGALELLLPQERRPWNRRALLSGTYLLFAGKLTMYVLVVTPAMRNAWVWLGLPSFHLDERLPLALYMPLALLVVTFTGYWSHRLMHRIPILWHIHKIHHAVENLNVTSSYQKHFLELLIHTPMHVFTVLLLGTDLVSPFGIIFLAVDFLAHSNVRLDMGRLSYVLCTPQAHRIHHSVDVRHYDTNFSNTFMLWDHVFGTFHYDPQHMPKAYGVTEPVPVSFVQQQLLPLAWMARDARKGVAALVARLRGGPTPEGEVS